MDTFTQTRLNGEIDSSRPSFASYNAPTGSFFSGNRTGVGGRVGWRQSQHLVLEGGVDHSPIDLPIANGEFAATTLFVSAVGAVKLTHLVLL